MGIIHGYITLVHDFPRFLGNCTHAQTVLVDTRATLLWGGGGGVGTSFSSSKVKDTRSLGMRL